MTDPVVPAVPVQGPQNSGQNPDPRINPMRFTREFQAGAAFGVPLDAYASYLHGLLAAADAVDPVRAELVSVQAGYAALLRWLQEANAQLSQHRAELAAANARLAAVRVLCAAEEMVSTAAVRTALGGTE